MSTRAAFIHHDRVIYIDVERERMVFLYIRIRVDSLDPQTDLAAAEFGNNTCVAIGSQ